MRVNKLTVFIFEFLFFPFNAKCKYYWGFVEKQTWNILFAATEQTCQPDNPLHPWQRAGNLCLQQSQPFRCLSFPACSCRWCSPSLQITNTYQMTAVTSAFPLLPSWLMLVKCEERVLDLDLGVTSPESLKDTM